MSSFGKSDDSACEQLLLCNSCPFMASLESGYRKLNQFCPFKILPNCGCWLFTNTQIMLYYYLGLLFMIQRIYGLLLVNCLKTGNSFILVCGFQTFTECRWGGVFVGQLLSFCSYEFYCNKQELSGDVLFVCQTCFTEVKHPTVLKMYMLQYKI